MSLPMSHSNRPISIALTAAALAAISCLGWAPHSEAQSLISEQLAERHGLARPWTAQVQVSRGLARLEHLVLFEDTLFAQTDRGLIQAIDAETGATLWVRQIGNPDYPTGRVGVGGDLVGAVNGMRLYVLNRYNGDLLYERNLDYAPGAGPAVSTRWAYVPMLTGMVVAYRLEPLTDPMRELGVIEEELTGPELEDRERDRRENIRLDQQYRKPLSVQTSGRIMTQPIATYHSSTAEYAAWTTERGHLNVGVIDPDAPDRLKIDYRIEASGPFASRPVYMPPPEGDEKSAGMLLATSEDGYVYAIDQKSGESLWRYSTGEPIVSRPGLAFPRVYICNQLGGMHCIDAERGLRIWWAPKICQFVSASEKLVYVLDMQDRLLSLDVETGAWIDTMPLPKFDIALCNNQTDRIYIAHATGLVQCLHELGVEEPIFNNRSVSVEEQRAQQEAAQADRQQAPADDQQPAAAEAPAGGEPDPFAGDDGGGAAQEDPFGGGGGGDPLGGGAEDPFGGGGGDGGGAAEENPFGGGGGADPFGGGDAADPFGG